MTQHHIYFLISNQHFVPTGGIGSFFRGFQRMANHFGWHVTVIMDAEPYKAAQTMKEAAQKQGSFIMPSQPVKYSGHNPDKSLHAKEVPNHFRVQNFRSALSKALEVEPPTHLLINTPEAGLAVLEMGLHHRIPTTFYTHHENLVLNPIPKSSKFGPSYMEMLFRIVGTPGITTATQSDYNLERMKHLELSAPPVVLPMPIPDPELLQPYHGKREGVLFIGRHEPRKQPAVFARKVAQAGLPAKVLTRQNSEEKFTKTFNKHGITDYELKSEITGQEKADFIRSARIAFHPAKLESYGFSAMETLAAGLPTLLVHEYGWWQAFIEEGVQITPIRDAQICCVNCMGVLCKLLPTMLCNRSRRLLLFGINI